MAVKGRMTLRRGKSALADGTTLMKLWDIETTPGTTAAALETRSYLAALDAMDKLEAYKSEAAQSGQFTEAGLNEAAKRFALSSLAPTLYRGRLEIAAAKKEASEKRATLTLQPPDKTDVVGHLRRQEIRSFLRTLPDQKRREFIAGNIDRLEPEMALAVIESPAELSGVLEADRRVLMDGALKAQHGAAITEITELERGIAIAEYAVELVRAEIAKDVGVDTHQFNQLAAPFEAKATAPYLKKFVERGVEIIRTLKMSGNGGIWAEATPEEVSSGIYYGSFAEYQAAHQGGVPEQ